MGNVKIIGSDELDRLCQAAAASPRRRRNLNLHPVLEDPIQRLFNAMEPGTYVRPHRHARAEGWEVMLALRGAFAILVFDPSGTVLERVDLSPSRGAFAIEIPAYTWHTAVVLAPETLLFEVKPGPYSPVEDKDFADWAPQEGEGAAAAFVMWYERARPGDRPPSLAPPPEDRMPGSAKTISP